MSTPKRYASSAEETRRIFSLAAPVALTNVGFMLMGFVDVLCVAMLEESAQLAAVSLGHIYSFSMLIFGWGVIRGLDPFMAQAHSSGDLSALGGHFWRAIALAVLLTIPAVFFHLVSGEVLELFGQPAQVVPITQAYCMALTWGLLPSLLFTALGQFLQNLERPALPTIAMLIANAVNVVLDYALVLGVEPLGIAPLGAVGCGHATSAVRWLMCAVLLLLGWRTVQAHCLGGFEGLRDHAQNLRVLKTGIPIGAQASLEGWAFSALGFMMGRLGQVELAAHAVVINIVSMTYMVPAGLGAAAATRIGHLVGLEDRQWPKSAWLSIAFSTTWMIGAGLFLWCARVPLALHYTSDEQVIAMIIALCPVAAAFQIFDGVQATAFGALRGVGDTTYPALVNMIGYWLIGLPGGYILGVHLGYGAVALWSGVALALLLISFLVLARLIQVAKRGVARV